MKTKLTEIEELKVGDRLMIPVQFEITEMGYVSKNSNVRFMKALGADEGVEIMYYVEFNHLSAALLGQASFEKIITE
jgi:hypothetical protein